MTMLRGVHHTRHVSQFRQAHELFLCVSPFDAHPYGKVASLETSERTLLLTHAASSVKAAAALGRYCISRCVMLATRAASCNICGGKRCHGKFNAMPAALSWPMECQNLLGREVWRGPQIPKWSVITDHSSWRVSLFGTPNWHNHTAQPQLFQHSSCSLLPEVCKTPITSPLGTCPIINWKNTIPMLKTSPQTLIRDRVWIQCVYIGSKTNPQPSIPNHQSLRFCPFIFPPTSESPFGYHNSVSQVSGGIYPAVPLQPLEVDRKPSAKPKSMRTTRGSSQSLPAAKLGTKIAVSQFINPLVQINLEGDWDQHNGFNFQSSHFHEIQNVWNDWKWMQPATMMFSSLISQCITFSRVECWVIRGGLDNQTLFNDHCSSAGITVWEVAPHHWLWCWDS